MQERGVERGGRRRRAIKSLLLIKQKGNERTGVEEEEEEEGERIVLLGGRWKCNQRKGRRATETRKRQEKTGNAKNKMADMKHMGPA